MKSLYLLITANNDQFYVIHEQCDPTGAIIEFEKICKLTELGYNNDKLVTKIEIITSEIYNFPEHQPVLYDKFAKLIISKNEKNIN